MTRERDPRDVASDEAREKNRSLVNAALGKHGWKLDRVGGRSGGQVIVYHLVREVDGLELEYSKLVSDIAMQSLAFDDTPVFEVADVKIAPQTLLLLVELVQAVKRENFRNPPKSG